MVGDVGNKANTAPIQVGVKVGAELGNIALKNEVFFLAHLDWLKYYENIIFARWKIAIWSV